MVAMDGHEISGLEKGRQKPMNHHQIDFSTKFVGWVICLENISFGNHLRMFLTKNGWKTSTFSRVFDSTAPSYANPSVEGYGYQIYRTHTPTLKTQTARRSQGNIQLFQKNLIVLKGPAIRLKTTKWRWWIDDLRDDTALCCKLLASTCSVRDRHLMAKLLSCCD